ncbi:SMI1/KNR4 family protein [Catellatospora bangladeshensis]|uniref:SMI1/KNR4 family protein n=1 Tax=Catellatospora bangladeshensis TaxID=310355 RepID=UPI00361B2E81
MTWPPPWPWRGARAAFGHGGAAFAAFESTHGQPLPRAVRDWYLLDRARTVLEPDGADLVLAAEQLGGPATYWWPADGDDWPPDLEEQEEREFDPVAAGLLPFLDENQGGYSLAVRLDGSADPPVLISWDGVRPDGWSVHAACFSEWVFTRVWDLPLLRGAGRLYGTVPDVGQSELAVLARRLTARPQTVSDSPLPGPPQVGHRFAGPGDRQRRCCCRRMPSAAPGRCCCGPPRTTCWSTCAAWSGRRWRRRWG